MGTVFLAVAGKLTCQGMGKIVASDLSAQHDLSKKEKTKNILGEDTAVL